MVAGGLITLLNAGGQLDLFFLSQEGCLADLLHVGAHDVAIR